MINIVIKEMIFWFFDFIFPGLPISLGWIKYIVIVVVILFLAGQMHSKVCAETSESQNIIS